MSRLRRFRASALLLAGAIAAAALSPLCYWHVVGWSRGEPFWRGRPTSFYATLLRANFPGEYRPGISWNVSFPNTIARRPGDQGAVKDCTPAEFWVRGNLGDTYADLLWGNPGSWISDFPPGGGPPADLVAGLLAPPDPQFQAIVLGWLYLIEQDALPAVPAVEAFLDHCETLEARTAAEKLLARLRRTPGRESP